jgi:Cys-tRNA(Pro) deacylase
MSEENVPVTPAMEVLRAAGVQYTVYSYSHEGPAWTAACAKELSVDEHSVVKTLVLEADGKPFMVLLHGDMRASTKELAKIIGAQSITPCVHEKAEQYTGYQAGGLSPFGTRTEMPVYMEESLLNLRKIYLGTGRRGYLLGMDPYDAVKILRPTIVKVGGTRSA